MKNSIKSCLLAAALFVLGACEESKTELPDAPAPVITADTPAAVPATGGPVAIAYRIADPREDAQLTASADAEWLRAPVVEAGTATFQADVYTGEEPRTATVTLSYPEAADVTVTVTQIPPQVARTVTFEIEIVSVSSRGVVVNCTPSDPEATYVGMAVHKEDFDKHDEDEQAIVDADIAYFREWWTILGDGNPDNALANMLRTGNMEDYDITLDKPESDYYFYAYGLTVEGEMTSPRIYKVPFRTIKPEPQECTFRFSIRPGISYTRVGVFPSSIYVSYHWDVMPKERFDAYGEDAAEKIVEEIKENIAAGGNQELFGDYVGYHNKKASYDDLTEGEQYVIFAFGCDGTGVVTTPLMKEEFTATYIDKQDCAFALAFKDIRASSFAVDITPTDEGTRWFAYTLPYEMLENYLSVEEMSEDVIDIMDEMAPGWTTGDEYVHTGRQYLSSYDILGDELYANTRQIVVAFGVNAQGSRTTDVSQNVVTTIAAGTPSTMVVEIEPRTWGYDSAEVTFTPSAKELYFFDIQPYEVYAESGSDEAFMDYLLFHYGVAGMTRYKMTVGQAKMTCENQLMPGTRYLGVAFGVDKEISTPLFKQEFTTGSVPMGGTATVTGLDLKIEDGDRYYASDPSRYAACKGKAVVTATATASAGAAGYYTACFDQVDEGMTDQQLTDLIVGYGDTEPTMYIAEWNRAVTFMALALDASGQAGAIRRQAVTPDKTQLAKAGIRAASRFGHTVTREILRTNAAWTTASAHKAQEGRTLNDAMQHTESRTRTYMRPDTGTMLAAPTAAARQLTDLRR